MEYYYPTVKEVRKIAHLFANGLTFCINDEENDECLNLNPDSIRLDEYDNCEVEEININDYNCCIAYAYR